MADKPPYGLHIPPNGKTWVYRFQVRKRKYYESTGCTSLRKAIEVAGQVKAEAMGQAPNRTRRKPEISLDEAFDRYWTEHSPNVKRPDELLARLGAIAEFFGPHTQISEVTHDHLLRYQTFLRKDRKNRTVNTYIMDTLRPFYEHACKWGVEVGPLGQKDFPWKDMKLRLPRPRVRWLTRQEKADLYKAVSKDYRPLVKFILLSALRATPALIRKSQVDFEMGLITYEKKSLYDNDVGFVPISEDIRRLLVAELNKSPADCPFVFTYRARRTFDGKVKGKRYPITFEGFKSEMGRATKRAGLEDWRQIHDLRHTAATEILRASKDLTATRDLLGHSDVAQTEKYAHVVKEDVRRAMEARRRNKA